ncbi:Rne/Rng family ribonuclease [Knoellia subterranea]|uniref:Ribonuclease E n=1 Tax=Knoellia subterranea KCTC 19937 TaxID=1385521 RepID=A0A0A0JHC0_9MICO|nr:Rne/Rng family ribonuclease [Knoellia subterranea]KGN36149.1 ribonuclease [Knoellia subterranea KCTC 19937]
MATQNDDTSQNTSSQSEAAATDAVESAPAKAPRRRRATKKTAAPAPASVESDAASAEPDSATVALSESTDAEAPAPKKKAARKAAKKAPKKAAVSSEASDGSSDETSDEKAAAKAARKPAKRASRSKKAAAAPVEEPTLLDEAAVDPAAADEAPADEIAESETGDAAITAQDESNEDESAEDDEQEAQVEAAPVVSSFGLLFQAPDTTKVVRRRRATAPAQAPSAAAIERQSGPEQADAAADEAAPEKPKRSRRGGRGRAAETETAEQNEAAEGEQSAAETAGESTDEQQEGGRRRRRGGRGRRGRGAGAAGSEQAESGEQTDASSGADSAAGDSEAEGRADDSPEAEGAESGSSRRRRRRRRSGSSTEGDDPPGTVTKVREPRKDRERDEPTAVKGSTRLEAKKQRRREGREAGRRRTIITEAEFLARRESVDRVMAVRGKGDKTQIGVLEDGVLVEHYVSRETNASMAGNVYLGRVQNVLPSMEAAFVDIGKGRNAVLYAGEVNWDAAGLEQNKAKRIENALSSGDTVLVQVTKDPIGHKGARLTSQISLPGRYLVYVPEGSMTGISRKLPDTERARLKAILKEVVPDHAGVIVRTAAEGASEEELRADVERLTKAWEGIQKKVATASAKKAGNGGAPVLLHGEADLTVRVIRDVFTEDFSQLVVSGDKAWSEVSGYVEDVAPDLAQRLTHWTSEEDLFAHYRVDEQIAKAMDRKVWLPSGGSLVIDRTEAMTVVDVNTGKFVGSGGNLEETVTKNNIEAAEEIVRQLRLRDIGGIIVIDFIDMVLESNRDLVVRRLLECLGRDRTKHQVAEVTSLGLVQMTRKRVGSGLIEVFSEPCSHCDGRGIIVQSEPIDRSGGNHDHGQHSGSGNDKGAAQSGRGRSRRGKAADQSQPAAKDESRSDAPPAPTGPTAAQIAAAAHAAAIKSMSGESSDDDVAELARATEAAEADVEAGQVTEAAEADAEAVQVIEAAEGEAEAVQVTDAPEVAEKPVVIAEVGPSADAPADEVRPVVAEPTPLDEPVVRPRRKRGRVVAPAGPPKSADLEQGEGDR